MNIHWDKYSEAISDFARATKVSLKGQFFRMIWAFTCWISVP